MISPVGGAFHTYQRTVRCPQALSGRRRSRLPGRFTLLTSTGGQVSPRSRPAALNETVSAQMARMPRASTGPEITLRRELHRRGLRFRSNHAQLPGRPDIVFTRARLAVFVDGCFWHRCPEHGVMPRNNRDWWQAKLERNVERDREKDRALVTLGWTPMHIWEHESVDAAADLVEREWRSRTDRQPRA